MLARFSDMNLLACYFPQQLAKAPFFRRCLELTSQHQAVRFLLTGDLNTGNQLLDRGEGAGKFYCADLFDQLETVGGLTDLWRSTHGTGCREWTWFSPKKLNGFRIDHAFGNAKFVESRPSCGYDHGARETRLTDHTALVIKIP
jgi:exonuclease III